MKSISVFLIVTLFGQFAVCYKRPEDKSAAYTPGDFVIGALLPLHLQPPAKNKKKHHLPVDEIDRLLGTNVIRCGGIRETYGIQRAEIAFFTIDAINNDVTILPNITLGIEIRDECWYAPVALQQSIELVRDSLGPNWDSDHCPNENAEDVSTERTSAESNRGPVIGVLGPGSSSVALQVQNLLQLFHMPQVGYSTTSKDLSDKSRYNYFVRVVPSDYHQAQVMLDIVQHYGWTYVSVVNTDENYGQSGIQAFRELSEKANVCIARENSVLSNAADETFDKVILSLKQDPNALVVVCFCEGFTVRGLLSATRRLNMTNHFLFIGSDGWADRGDVISGYEPEAWGSLSIRIHTPPALPAFQRYYEALRPRTNGRNPWFREFWEARFHCHFRDTAQELRPVPIESIGSRLIMTMTDEVEQLVVLEEEEEEEEEEEVMVNGTMRGSGEVSGGGGTDSPRVEDTGKMCTGEESLADVSYKLDSKLSFVSKGIYSFAYALHSMQQELCHEKVGLCEKLFPFNGSLFKDYLLNVSFIHDGDLIHFDENGDPPGRYDILNYQKFPDGSYDYVQIGDWNNSLKWSSTDIQLGPHISIKSVCSQSCASGHYKTIQKGGKDKRCCWICVPCPYGEYIPENSEDQPCQKCPLGYSTNSEQTTCYHLPILHMEWYCKEAITAIIFASMGLLSTTFSFVFFLRYHDTPVVKSSTKELSFIILVGMAISHISVFPILAKPTVVTCTLSRFLPGLSFAMIYASLLTKTNRIARILAGSKRRFPTKKRLFMSSASQVVISATLIGVQVFIGTFMLYHQQPDIANRYLSDSTVLECNTTPEGVITPLAFDFFLILLCTVYALKTRNVPENFNEAKFIGFAMYTTCVIWIAFVPIYFGSDSKVVTMCLCVTLSAQVTWFFLFIPKLYIIIFRPERNNRSFFTTSKSIRCHFGTRVSSALSEKSSVTSWRDSAADATSTAYKQPLQMPPEIKVQQRTLSCQTGADLLQMLMLDPKLLLTANGNLMVTAADKTVTAKITERDCCETDGCELKKITITLPDP